MIELRRAVVTKKTKIPDDDIPVVENDLLTPENILRTKIALVEMFQLFMLRLDQYAEKEASQVADYFIDECQDLILDLSTFIEKAPEMNTLLIYDARILLLFSTFFEKLEAIGMRLEEFDLQDFFNILSEALEITFDPDLEISYNFRSSIHLREALYFLNTYIQNSPTNLTSEIRGKVLFYIKIFDRELLKVLDTFCDNKYLQQMYQQFFYELSPRNFILKILDSVDEFLPFHLSEEVISTLILIRHNALNELRQRGA